MKNINALLTVAGLKTLNLKKDVYHTFYNGDEIQFDVEQKFSGEFGSSLTIISNPNISAMISLEGHKIDYVYGGYTKSPLTIDFLNPDKRHRHYSSRRYLYMCNGVGFDYKANGNINIELDCSLNNINKNEILKELYSLVLDFISAYDSPILIDKHYSKKDISKLLNTMRYVYDCNNITAYTPAGLKPITLNNPTKHSIGYIINSIYSDMHSTHNTHKLYYEFYYDKESNRITCI